MTQPISESMCCNVFERDYLEAPVVCKLVAGHHGHHVGTWHTTGTLEWLG